MNRITIVWICLAAIIRFSQQIPAQLDDSPDYNQCGETYQCFGLPDGCVDNWKCEVLLKTEAEDTGDVDFSLYWWRMDNSTDSWVAAGISTDKDTPMNDASTAVFVLGDDNSKNNISVMLGLTHVGNNNTGFTPMKVSGHTIEKKVYVNGLMRVQWRREQVTKVGKMVFDLRNTSYVVILARGPVVQDHIKPHTAKWASSPNAYNLESEPVASSGTTVASPNTTVGSTGTPSNTTGTETVTMSSTTDSNSTATTDNSTGTAQWTSTSKPESTTKGKGTASAITLSTVSALIVSIVLFFK